MSHPDLSQLFPTAEPASSPPERPERRGPQRASGNVAELITRLRASQAELEVQNQVLRYSQAAAESASERFEALFSSVPLSLMWWTSMTWWSRPTPWHSARSNRARRIAP